MYRAFLLALLMFVCGRPVSAQEWLTDYEKSNYLETPRYEPTVEFCRRLDEYSPIVKFTDFGTSPQGRKLPLLILDVDGKFDPASAHAAGKAVLLVQAGIHSGEIEGKDAGLTLIRDMIIYRKFIDVLDNVVILFLPIFSVDAHERFGPFNRINQQGPKAMGWRTTAHNLNLNRDFTKADAPEMQHWLRLFAQWLPDMLVDIHTTDGADYQYTISYAIESNASVAPPLAQWIDQSLLPVIKQRMTESQYPFIPYVMTRFGHDYTKGIITVPFGPRFSNGYGAVQNRPFFLIETHMLKPYEERVRSTYEFLRHLIRHCSDNAATLKYVNKQSDELTAGLAGKFYPVKLERSPDSTMIDFLGVEFHEEDSEISGAKRVIWSDVPRKYRLPMYDRYVATDSVLLPAAYLIPQEWSDVISRIELHGIEVRRLSDTATLNVEQYRLTEPKFAAAPFEGRFGVEFKSTTEATRRQFAAGTAVVLVNQRANRLIAQLLEPKFADSFLRWGFFNAIFEQKEYAEDYVMEEKSRIMLAADPALKAEFEAKLAADTAFAASKDMRLDFFYRKTPFWDDRLGLYPVVRLKSAAGLPVK